MHEKPSGVSYGHANPRLVNAFANSLEPITSAFNDLETVERRTIVDIQSSEGTSSLRDVISESGSANIPQDAQQSGELLVESGTTSGSTATLDTALYGQYTSGYIAQQGIGVRIPNQPIDDQEIRWGYFSDNDGFFWGYDADGLYVARLRNGSVEGKTYRGQWNEADPDDIRAESAQAWELSEGAIFQIDFAWYGYGAIEFRIVSSAKNKEQRVATVHKMALVDQTSITNPNQPIRMRVDNGTTTSNLQAYVGGRQFSILGSPTNNYRITSQSRQSASVASGSWTHLVSMRRKSGEDRNINVSIGGFGAYGSGNMRVALVMNPNISGQSWTNPDLTDSSETQLESATDGTFDGIGSGTKIYEDVVSGANNKPGGADLQDLNIRVPRNQPVSLLAYGIGNSPTASATMRLEEDW